MFRVLGHEKVWVPDGGLPRWRAPGDAILKASAASEAIEKIYQGHSVSQVFLVEMVSSLSFHDVVFFSFFSTGQPSNL